jgi:hypothetical protein
MKVTSRLSPFLRVFPRLGVSSPIAHGHLIKSFADSVQVEVGALLLQQFACLIPRERDGRWGCLSGALRLEGAPLP